MDYPHVYDPEYKVDGIRGEIENLLSIMMIGEDGYGHEYSGIRDNLIDVVGNEAIAYTHQLAMDVVEHSDLNPDDKQEFMEALRITRDGSTIFIGMNGDASWKIRAIEYGCPSFDMKPGLLKNAFVSETKVWAKGPGNNQIGVKVGKRYRRVPITEKKFRGFTPSSPSSGSSDYQKKVKEAIKASRYKWKKMDEITNKDDSFTIFEELKVPKSQNEHRQNTSKTIARTRTYKNQEAYENSKRTPEKETVTTFKTVSEDSTGWFHPGFPGKFLLYKIKSDLESNLDQIVFAVAQELLGEQE